MFWQSNLQRNETQRDARQNCKLKTMQCIDHAMQCDVLRDGMCYGFSETALHGFIIRCMHRSIMDVMQWMYAQFSL